ncbi:hypothetical protein [Gilliamella sp. Bif1-4]|uniref:hypothetical protein n=1 Tax=Gilliamella sp. Bif1-4 TaxID=3120233 RepID=UPI00159EE8B0|nr:hypothetical protein [Gilliamella apicola]
MTVYSAAGFDGNVYWTSYESSDTNQFTVNANGGNINIYNSFLDSNYGVVSILSP